MAETKIIPLELRALIYSHLFGSFHGFGMLPERHSLAEVIPLDIPDVRKTQRRVAALLGKTPPDYLIHKHPSTRYSHDSSIDAYNQLHSIRRLLGDGARRRSKLHPQMPPAPQNSFLGLNNDDNVDNDSNEEEDESYGLDLFDTGLFHEDTDPNAFKLPSVFSTPLHGGGGLRRRHNRLVPTVSERSFVNSNLRNKILDKRNHGGHFESRPSPPSGETSSLPRIDPLGRDLVSMKTEDFEDDMKEERGGNSPASNAKGRRKKSRETSQQDSKAEMTSELIRMMTLESERTGASLLTDENFIPMSVTITKLTDGHKHQYENDLSSSISGSISVSRETSLASSDGRSSSCCTCAEPQPQMLPSKSACTTCLKLGSHEDWCPQKGADGKRDITLMCMGCGKAIPQRKHHGGKRPKGATNRKSSGSVHERSPVTPETAVGRLTSSTTDTHNGRECSGKAKHRAVRRTSQDNNHVRFDEQVTHVPQDQSEKHSYSTLKCSSVLEESEHNQHDLDGSSDYKKRGTSKKLFVSRQQPNSKSYQISELGVSVHKMAYDMALRDARMTGAYKKKAKKTKGIQLTDISSSTGTMFSYFPLLKRQRPYSESDRLDIGLKAIESPRVKPKEYMKHIFGSVKIADYYPGGKKWKDR